jgi:hypothetical protein
VSSEHSFTAVLFAAASGPADSLAGWIVTSNATNDVLFAWSNASSSGPVCAAGVSPRGTMVPTYALCAGSGLFPDEARAFTLAGVPAAVFTQGHASMTFGGDATVCAPVALVGDATPLGTGAYSFSIESGVPAAPPTTWAAPPAYCEGRWAWAASKARAAL